MLGVRRHAITILANATGHQFSCIFGSVLCFLGRTSRHHHHWLGVRGKGAEFSCCNTLSLFYTCTEADLWKSNETAHKTLGSVLPMHTEELQTSFVCGIVAEILFVLRFSSLALLMHAEVGTVVLQLLTPVHANTCACSRSSLTPAACSDITARPFKTPLGVNCSC